MYGTETYMGQVRSVKYTIFKRESQNTNQFFFHHRQFAQRQSTPTVVGQSLEAVSRFIFSTYSPAMSILQKSTARESHFKNGLPKIKM